MGKHEFESPVPEAFPHGLLRILHSPGICSHCDCFRGLPDRPQDAKVQTERLGLYDPPVLPPFRGLEPGVVYEISDVCLRCMLAIGPFNDIDAGEQHAANMAAHDCHWPPEDGAVSE